MIREGIPRRTRAWVVLALLVAAGAFLLLGAPAAVAYDGQIIPWSGNYKMGGGGEFNIQVISGIPYYTLVTPWSYDFATFCLVEDMALVTGNLYNVNVSTIANDGDPLTPEAAWLFHTWNSLALTGYDYANALGERKTDAYALQQALWALEGDIAPGSLSGEALTWYNDAVGCGWGDTGYIYVMNLFDRQGLPHQSLLVSYVPEPGAMAASLALLAPGGLSLVWRLRRRRSRKLD